MSPSSRASLDLYAPYPVPAGPWGEAGPGAGRTGSS